jgi:hypothetical protein
MPEPTIQEKTAVNLREQWRERIAEHVRSGLSIKQFCKGCGIAEHLLLLAQAATGNGAGALCLEQIIRRRARGPCG